MKSKHGLNKYRLYYAKGYTKDFFEAVCKIEMMHELSIEGMVDEKIAEDYITRNINELDRNWEEFKSYITQRKDMR